MLDQAPDNSERPLTLTRDVTEAMLQFRWLAESTSNVLKFFPSKEGGEADHSRPRLQIWPKGLEKAILRVDTNIEMPDGYPHMSLEVEFRKPQEVRLNDGEVLLFRRVILTNEYTDPSVPIEVAPRFTLSFLDPKDLSHNARVALEAELEALLADGRVDEARSRLNQALLKVDRESNNLVHLERIPGFHLTLFGRLNPKYTASFRGDEPTELDANTREELHVTSQVLNLLHKIPGMEIVDDDDTIPVPDPE